MTFTQAQVSSPLTYQRAIEVQDLLVRRGVLTARAHDIVAGRFIAGDQVELLCSCGRHMILDADSSESEWAQHASRALGVSFGLAA